MLNSDYRDMLSCLQRHSVEFVVVGAYALAAHGLPRATSDIDLLLRSTPENGLRTLAALAEFGAPVAGLDATTLLSDDTVLQIGVAPCRIDLLTAIDGVTTEEVWRNRIAISVDGLQVAVIARDDLLRNKRAAARPQDLVDAQWLEQHGA